MDQELVKYIRDNYQKGFPLERIVEALRSVGWRESDIAEAVNTVVPYYTPVSSPAPIVQPQESPMYGPDENVTQSANANHHVVLFVFLGIFAVVGLLVLVNVLNVSMPSAYQEVLTKVNEVRSDVASSEIPIPESSDVPSQEIPSSTDSAVQYPSQEVIAPKASASCTSFSCFKNTVSSCGPSSIRDTVIKDGLGTKERVTSFYELRGFDDTKCKFYVKTESIDVSYTDSYRVQLAKQGNSIPQIDAKEVQENIEADKKEGLDGVCLIRPENITVMLDRWEQGVFRTTDMSKKFCTGGLFP